MRSVREKRDSLLEEDLCDHCLGRQFAQLGHGLENYERGAIAREIEDIGEDDFVRENVPEDASPGGECGICQGVFEKLEHWVDLVLNAFERHDLDTFLIGIRPPEEVVEAEEELWERHGLEHVEPIKTELSRLIGKRVEDSLDVEVDFRRPDVNAVIDLGKDRVELQVNSLLVYGEYNKLERGIPQTVWHCRKCRGSGCEECEWTGKQYQESVQEIIEEPFKRETKAVETRFHGCGREDVDTLCLGRRPFILELLEPLNRDLDLGELQQEVNDSQDKVEVFNLRYAEKDEVEELKNARAEKTYRARVRLEGDVSGEDLEKLEGLAGEIEQFTPQRVQHRRAEKTRKREVKDVSYEKLGDREIELEIRSEAGTYIKELVTGDDGNTQPSVSGILGTGAEVETLDVIEIEK